jgi:hypothetical protein
MENKDWSKNIFVPVNNDNYTEIELTSEEAKKMIEDSKIHVHRYNDPVRMKFIIPIGNMNGEEAKKAIAELISDYKEEIIFDDVTGEVKINETDRVRNLGRSRTDNQPLYSFKDKQYIVKVIDGKDLYIKPSFWSRLKKFFTKKNKS